MHHIENFVPKPALQLPISISSTFPWHFLQTQAFWKALTIFKISTIFFIWWNITSASWRIVSYFCMTCRQVLPLCHIVVILVNFCNVFNIFKSTFSWRIQSWLFSWAFFRCCKRFTAITGHNKQMSVALITTSIKMWTAFIVV